MDFKEFQEKFHISLTDQQLAAVERVDGPTLLLAVPGSGKTTVLVTRLGYMIHCKNIAPENILTLTYTVAATKDMANRFCSLFGEDLRSRMEFRTINGICARILYYYGRCVGKEMFPLISKEEERKGILSLIYRQIMKDYATEGELQEIGAAITFIKNMMMTDEELDAFNEKSKLHIKEIYQAYTAELKRQKRIDYDDQMIYAWKILKSVPKVLTVFQRKYRYICVDEAQDTSKIQHAIIALLAQDNENLFMVGDEDQSIYGFRAAYPQALLDFEKNHPQAQVLLMEKNFRSDANIVAAADFFIQKNQLRHKKQMSAARPEKVDITFVGVRTRKAQHAFLAQMALKSYESSGFSDKKTAILYRDNECAIPLIDLLERDQIPYQLKNNDLTFFSHRTVMDIRNIIHFAKNPQDTDTFMKIYYKISLYMNKQSAQQAVSLSLKHELPVLDAALRYMQMPAYAQQTIRDMQKNFKRIRCESALDAINLIIGDMGYASFLSRASLSDAKMFTLRAIAAREQTTDDFIRRLDQLQEIVRTKDPDPGASLILSTIHGSKGLEYDTVYMLDVCDGVFPEKVPGDFQSMEPAEQEAWEEERRLFYVGITRAKNNLCLFNIRKEDSTFTKEIRRFSAIQREKKERKEEEARLERLRRINSAAGISGSAQTGYENNFYRNRSSSNILNTALSEEQEKEYQQFCEKLGEGMFVEHKAFGPGVITSKNTNAVSIRFQDGEKLLGLKILFLKKLLKY